MPLPPNLKDNTRAILRGVAIGTVLFGGVALGLGGGVVAGAYALTAGFGNFTALACGLAAGVPLLMVSASAGRKLTEHFFQQDAQKGRQTKKTLQGVASLTTSIGLLLTANAVLLPLLKQKAEQLTVERAPVVTESFNQACRNVAVIGLDEGGAAVVVLEKKCSPPKPN
jgi:hypothetical protein